MKFGPDEETAYYAARDQLIDDFRVWNGGREAVGHHVDSLLDFKWQYVDGDLLSWRGEHVEEFLVDWMPRKASLPDDTAPAVVLDVKAFFAFLGETGRLEAGSDPPARLIALTHELGADLGARMADRSRWGMAKALANAMHADGVELGDQRAMDAWIEEFNARPLHEREAVVGPAPRAPEDDEPVALSPRPRPDPLAVRAVAADAPILARMLALSEYLGAGRPLTKKGNLKLVDARALVQLLDTGDKLEEKMGEHTYTTRSAVQLPRLDLIVRWAKQARVVRVVKGSLLGTALFRKLAHDPVAALDRLADVLFAVGPLLMHRHWTFPALEESEQFTDAAVVSMLMATYQSGEDLDFEHLVERAAEGAALWTPPEWHLRPELREQWTRRDLADAFRGLEDAGILEHHGYTERAEKYGWPSRAGGTIALTAFGVATVQRIAPTLGFDAPVIEAFDASADDEPVVVIRALRVQLDRGGPAALVTAIDALGPAVGELVGTAWRVDDPAVLPVLEAIGRHHLDKSIARAARKAVIQHRSWLANRA